MQIATLEHINITVSDPRQTAAMLSRIFGWHIRWKGPSMDNGYTIHVGTKTNYVALYAAGTPKSSKIPPCKMQAGLNHIALVVEDLDAAEKRVLAEGLKTSNHSDYEPGRRFYFRDADNVEYEIVSYNSQKEAFKKQVTRQLGIMSMFGALVR